MVQTYMFTGVILESTQYNFFSRGRGNHSIFPLKRIPMTQKIMGNDKGMSLFGKVQETSDLPKAHGYFFLLIEAYNHFGEFGPIFSDTLFTQTARNRTIDIY